MDLTKLILEKLDKIDEKQTEHTVQLAINSQILAEHHKRSTMLEERMKPIENHVVYIRKTLKMLGAIIATATSIAGIISLFTK